MTSGVSYQQRKPVTEIIAAALPPTAALTGLAMMLAIVFALVGALVSAGRGRVARFVAQGLELIAIAVPSFWIGLILLSVFAFTIPLFPSTGADGFASLVLPALTLSLPLAGVLGQILRERLDETLEQPHTLTARTRGAERSPRAGAPRAAPLGHPGSDRLRRHRRVAPRGNDGHRDAVLAARGGTRAAQRGDVEGRAGHHGRRHLLRRSCSWSSTPSWTRSTSSSTRARARQSGAVGSW